MLLATKSNPSRSVLPFPSFRSHRVFVREREPRFLALPGFPRLAFPGASELGVLARLRRARTRQQSSIVPAVPPGMHPRSRPPRFPAPVAQGWAYADTRRFRNSRPSRPVAAICAFRRVFFEVTASNRPDGETVRGSHAKAANAIAPTRSCAAAPQPRVAPTGTRAARAYFTSRRCLEGPGAASLAAQAPSGEGDDEDEDEIDYGHPNEARQRRPRRGLPRGDDREELGPPLLDERHLRVQPDAVSVIVAF